MPPMIATMTTMKQMMLTMHSSMNSMYDQMDVMSQNSTAMGQAYDAAKNDDSFYIPPEVFDNPDFKRGLKMFVSPDGHAARFIISHDGPPATPRGHFARRADQDRGEGSHQGDPGGGRQDLARRHGRGL